ncbi:MAG: SAF domain-containing protein [Ilumatobacteraceae bacterium]
MVTTEQRPGDRAVEARGGEPRGFRPASRRRSRIAAGVALAALAIGGNVLLYTSLDDKREVLQLVDNVRAGERVTIADLRIVEVDLDPTIPVVAADDIGLVANQFARVFLPSGSLIHPDLVQPEALISVGSGVVAVQITPTRLPAGLSTRSQVLLVLVDDDQNTVVPARVVRIGSEAAGDVGSLSVEVAVDSAPSVAAADDVRVVLIEPGTDPATESGATQAGDG